MFIGICKEIYAGLGPGNPHGKHPLCRDSTACLCHEALLTSILPTQHQFFNLLERGVLHILHICIHMCKQVDVCAYICVFGGMSSSHSDFILTNLCFENAHRHGFGGSREHSWHLHVVNTEGNAVQIWWQPSLCLSSSLAQVSCSSRTKIEETAAARAGCTFGVNASDDS